MSGHAQFLASLSGSSDGDPMAFFVFWDACFFNKTVYSDFLSFKTETTGTGAETTLEGNRYNVMMKYCFSFIVILFCAAFLL